MKSIASIASYAVLVLALMFVYISSATKVVKLEKKVAAYEQLIQGIEQDNQSYFDDVLCETDEWSEVYN